MTVYTAGGDFSNPMSWTPQSIPGAGDTIEGAFLSLVGAGMIDTLIAENSPSGNNIAIGGPLTTNTATLQAGTAVALNGGWDDIGALVVLGELSIASVALASGSLQTEGAVTLSGAIGLGGGGARWNADVAVTGTGGILTVNFAEATLLAVSVGGLSADTNSNITVLNNATIDGGAPSAIDHLFVKGAATIDVAGNLTGDNTGILLTDAGSELSAVSVIFGNTAGAELTMQSGATLSDMTATLGAEFGSNGSANIISATWENVGDLTVGGEGSGTLGVEFTGARVTDHNGIIGAAATGSGVVSVQFNGLWSSSGNLVVGGGGAGELTIGNGGEVTVQHTVSIAVGAPGTVTVSGAQSTLDSTDININPGGTLELDTGGRVEAVSLDDHGLISNNGGRLDTDPLTIESDGVLNGFGMVTGGVTNDGSIGAAGGTLEFTSPVSGGGSIDIGTSADLQFDAAVGGSVALAFAGVVATLDLNAPLQFDAVIGGYVGSDTVMVNGIGGQPAPDYAPSGDNTVVTFANGITLTFAGSFAPGSIDIVACYASGTRLLTAAGEVAVEHLQVGDSMVTRGGALRPVIWIGRRRIDCRQQNVWPVRVCAGAFGDRMPHRDLWLSPDHGVFIDGGLIPVRYLINGATVVAEEVESITYWHVELDRHEVILAEGLPCESYLDTGNRNAFDEDCIELVTAG